MESAATFSGIPSNNENGILAGGPIQLLNLSVTLGGAHKGIHSTHSITATSCSFHVDVYTPSTMFDCSNDTGTTSCDITLRNCQVTNAYFNVNSDLVFCTDGTVMLEYSTVKAQYTDPVYSLVSCGTLTMSGESSLRIFPGMDAPKDETPGFFVTVSKIDLQSGLKITTPSGGTIGTDRFGHCVILDADGNVPASITME